MVFATVCVFTVPTALFAVVDAVVSPGIHKKRPRQTNSVQLLRKLSTNYTMGIFGKATVLATLCLVAAADHPHHAPHHPVHLPAPLHHAGPALHHGGPHLPHAGPLHHAPVHHAAPLHHAAPVHHAAPLHHAPVHHHAAAPAPLIAEPAVPLVEAAEAPYHPPPPPPAPYHPAPHHVEHKVPAPYSYQYAVADDYTHTAFNADQTADPEGNVIGSYSVALPDGRTQHVTYRADHYNGFVADVTYEGQAVYPPPAEPYHHPAPVHHAPAHHAPVIVAEPVPLGPHPI